MVSIEEPARRTPIAGEYDVVVAGAGTAGVFAAVSAARNGARTLVLERAGFMGGHIATQLLEHSAGWFDAEGRPMVGGLPDELVRRLQAADASPGHVRDDTGYTRLRLPVDHEAFKSVVTAWLAEEGVDFLVYSPLVAVLEAGDRMALVVENKTGREAYLTRAAVDATGDADLCHLAGCDFLPAPDGVTQAVSLLFKIGGVDHAALIDYVEANPEEFKLGVAPGQLRGEPFVNLWGFGELLARGHASGELSLERQEFHYAGDVARGEAVINVTRTAADATDAHALAQAETVLRRQVLEFVAFFRRHLPGGERAHLVSTAACVGVRESRRVRGRALLGDDDVRNGRTRPDAVARGGFPIDSHDPQGSSMDAAEHVPGGYDIPFGALLPDRGPNVVVAGRCISADRKALASARITGTCMAMGQAAGAAAALSARERIPLSEIDVPALQRLLRAQGAIFAG